MIQNIEQIFASANKLQQLGKPHRATTIDVLVATSAVLFELSKVVEIGQLKRSDPFIRDIAPKISAKSGISTNIVLDVLDKYHRLNLGDDSKVYRDANQHFLDSGISKEEALCDLRGASKNNSMYFVLHRLIYRWIYDKHELLIIPIEDNDTNDICIGYLVGEGLAFHTRLELLESSLENSWPEWPAMWQYF